MSIAKIEVGAVYSGLTVIARSNIKRKSGNYKWIFSCHCGNTFEARSDSVRSGRTKSCGCTSYNHIAKGENSSKWTGCGDLSGNKFSSIRTHARTRNIPFEITVDDAWQQFLKQDRRCTYTGEVLTMIPRSDCWGEDNTASLDRIDSSLGYTVDNIQWVHKTINKMKLDLDSDDFIKICANVTEYRRNGR